MGDWWRMFDPGLPKAATFKIKISRKRSRNGRANAYFHRITERGGWKCLVEEGSRRTIKTRFRRYFHTYWTIAGHRIRDQVFDDELLARFLRANLPQYVGGKVFLFRGENRDRWLENRIGLCWTKKIETAEMFGRGLNAFGSGGVLLQCDAHESAVIAGPSAHSEHLGEIEFTVDSKLLQKIEAIREFPSSH